MTGPDGGPIGAGGFIVMMTGRARSRSCASPPHRARLPASAADRAASKPEVSQLTTRFILAGVCPSRVIRDGWSGCRATNGAPLAEEIPFGPKTTAPARWRHNARADKAHASRQITGVSARDPPPISKRRFCQVFGYKIESSPLSKDAPSNRLSDVAKTDQRQLKRVCA